MYLLIMYCVGQHDGVMTFGHTSQGTKLCRQAYFYFCVMQKAADRVGRVGEFCPSALTHGDLSCNRQSRRFSHEWVKKLDPSMEASALVQLRRGQIMGNIINTTDRKPLNMSTNTWRFREYTYIKWTYPIYITLMGLTTRH